MDKINFNNLPSQTTAVSAENLNQLQSNVEKVANYIGTTTPTTDEKVWIKKGKNIANMYKFSSIENSSMNVSITTNGCVCTNTGTYSRVRFKFDLPDEYLNKSMVFSLKGVGSAVPGSGSASRVIINADGSDTGSYGLFTMTTTNTRYNCVFTPTVNSFCFTVYNTTSYSSAITVTLSEIQLEQASAVTDYEAYVEKKIVTKNSSSNFEEFLAEDYGKKSASSIAYSSTYIPSANIQWSYANKYKKIVYLNSLVTVQTQIPSWTSFGTLPSGYAPDSSQESHKFLASTPDGNSYCCEAMKNGNLRSCGNSIPANTVLQITTVYMI